MAGKRVRVGLREVDLKRLGALKVRFKTKNQSKVIREAILWASSTSIQICGPESGCEMAMDTSVLMDQDVIDSIEEIRAHCPSPISRNHAIREALRVAYLGCP